jgi:hypothetical protein
MNIIFNSVSKRKSLKEEEQNKKIIQRKISTNFKISKLFRKQKGKTFFFRIPK